MIISKKIKSLSVIAMMMVLCIGCTTGGNEVQEVSQLDAIKNAGKLVLGTSADYPPYEYHMEIDGKDTIVGFDIEVAKEIAKDLGVELEIKDMDFDGLLMALNSDKVDMVIAGMTPDPERQKVVDFSEIYYRSVHGIVIHKDNAEAFKTAADLKGKKVGAQKGAIQEDIATTEIENVELKSLGKIPDLILEVKNNKVDAVVMEKSVAQAYVSNNPDLTLMEVVFEDAEGGSAVAMKKGEAELVAEVNKTLERLMADGSIDKFVVEATEMVNGN